MSDHKLVDMRRSKKERKSNEVAIEEPSLPFGLSITLDDDSLKKLGFKELPAVGSKMVVAAIGTVKSVSERSSSRRKNRDVSIDLERLDVSPAPARKAKTAEEAITEAIKDV